MATKIIMCETPLMGPKLRQLTNMLGMAVPKSHSYIKISFKDDDSGLCSIEYEGKTTVLAREALEWLGLTDKNKTDKQ